MWVNTCKVLRTVRHDKHSINVRGYYYGGSVGGDIHITPFKYVKSCHMSN